ncbi:MAG: asparagine synthase (glutamine-hydrolyzing) [Lentisphaerota bacterium]
MCGFLTIFNRSGQLNSKIIDKCRDTMCHRGPDDAGTWIRQDGCLAMAHRRLSILDLSPLGHQPMTDQAGRFCIVFNGEIYNHLDIRAELAGQWRFHSHSDTETIIAAYMKWGDRCLDRLQGMFSFVLYDAVAERLFAARDRAGEKPFYYRIHAGGFQAVSELKALLADPAFPRSIEPAALNSYLTFGYIPGDTCILSGVNKLPPAHALSYDLNTGKSKIWRYWQLPEPQPVDDAEALLEQIETLLEASVRRQLIADVPVGVLLSGGVDSSLVTAMAAKVSQGQVKTFTIAFPGQGMFDESAYARLVANHFGTAHTELAAEPATVELLPVLARQFDEPMCDSSMVPTYLVSRLIKQHCTVAIGGDGGDELFGGYPLYQLALRQVSLRDKIPSFIRNMAASVATSFPIGIRGRNYAIGLGGQLDQALACNSMFFDPKSRIKLSPILQQFNTMPDPALFRANLFNQRRGLPGAAMAMDFGSYMPEDILVKVDRASMLASLEIRAPFLDHNIIEFAFARVPNHLRTNLNDRKIMLKKLAVKLLPSELDINRKQGFSLPLSKWFAGQWGKYMEEVLMESPANVFDRRFVKSLIAGQHKGRSNTERIFSLVLFELWRREYQITI